MIYTYIYMYYFLLLEDLIGSFLEPMGFIANATIVISLLILAYHFKHIRTLGRFLSTGTTWLILTIFIFALFLGLGWIPEIHIGEMMSDLSTGIKTLFDLVI